MDRKALPQKYASAKRAYERDENIIRHLDERYPEQHLQNIEISYSIQSGSYTRTAHDPVVARNRREMHELIVSFLDEHRCQSLLDCGIGEGTSWLEFSRPVESFFGLDASFHRLMWCQKNLGNISALSRHRLCKANMLDLPFADAAIDAAVTMHAVEPNHEEDTVAIVKELARVAAKLIILIEPNYRSASPAMRERMECHAYSRNIWQAAESLESFSVEYDRPLRHANNSLNVSSCLVLKRTSEKARPDKPFRSPIDGSPLVEQTGVLIDTEGCYGFPIVAGVACLASEDAIFLGVSQI